jgi:serine/threonine protein kinase
VLSCRLNGWLRLAYVLTPRAAFVGSLGLPPHSRFPSASNLTLRSSFHSTNLMLLQRTFREIIYLQEFGGHENIITLIDVIKADNDKDIYLVFEHMDADLHMVCQGKLLEPVHVAFVMCQYVTCLDTEFPFSVPCCFCAVHYTAFFPTAM